MNGRRKQEIALIFKQIFNIARHYACAYFVMEDLNFKNSNKKKSKEANRKINNLWHLNLTKFQISKRCNQQGIILIEVNACYSSFIGNIQHNYTDPINASIEIGRRGLFYRKKDMFYPHKTIKDTDTLYALFGDLNPNKRDDLYMTEKSWVSTYKSSQKLFNKPADFEHRWRVALETIDKNRYEVFSMNTYKSRIKVIKFYNL